MGAAKPLQILQTGVAQCGDSPFDHGPGHVRVAARHLGYAHDLQAGEPRTHGRGIVANHIEIHVQSWVGRSSGHCLLLSVAESGSSRLSINSGTTR